TPPRKRAAESTRKQRKKRSADEVESGKQVVRLLNILRTLEGARHGLTVRELMDQVEPTAVDGRDRKRLERLCRYLARPPIAQDRLELLADGRVHYTLKKAWRDGTRAIVLEPHGLIARLCAMIPPPRFNMIRFHGLFAPAAKRRAQVVPQKECLSLTDASPAELPRARQMDLFGRDELAPRRRPWAHLLRHVFLVDVTVCPDCGGRMKWLELATETRDILRI